MPAVSESAIVTLIEEVQRSTLPDKLKLIQALYAVLQGAQGQGGAAVASSAPTFKAATDNGISAINQAISYFTSGDGKNDPNAQLIAGRLKQILIQENIGSLKAKGVKPNKDMIDTLQSDHDDIDAKLKKLSGVKKSVPEFDLARDAIRKSGGSESEKYIQIKAIDILEAKQLAKAEPSSFDAARDVIKSANYSALDKEAMLISIDKQEAEAIDKAQAEELPEEVRKNIPELIAMILRDSATPEEAAKKIMGVNSADVSKAAHDTQDAPIQDTGTWDSSGAIKRLYAWAGGDKGKKFVNWSKFGTGFLWHDESAPDKIASYKYPVGDIVNGKLVINRDALAAAAQRIEQSKGISAAELSQMKGTLRDYYKQIGVAAPPSLGS